MQVHVMSTSTTNKSAFTLRLNPMNATLNPHAPAVLTGVFHTIDLNPGARVLQQQTPGDFEVHPGMIGWFESIGNDIVFIFGYPQSPETRVVFQ